MPEGDDIHRLIRPVAKAMKHTSKPSGIRFQDLSKYRPKHRVDG